MWMDTDSFPADFSLIVVAINPEKRADAAIRVPIRCIVIVGIAIVVGIAEPRRGSNRNQTVPRKYSFQFLEPLVIRLPPSF